MEQLPLIPSATAGTVNINELMQLAALRIAAVIATLTERGFTVIGIEFSSRCHPTVQVQNCHLCHQLVESGEAAYYRSGTGDSGRYRTGQFKLDSVRVLWTETGH